MMVYDADCGPCARFKNVISILDRQKRIDFMSLMEADSLGLLGPIPSSLRFKSFHLISPTGKVRSGEDALIDLIELLPGGRTISKIIVSTPYGVHLTKSVYSQFSRLHDNGLCHVKDSK